MIYHTTNLTMTSHHCNFTFILLIKLYNYRNDTIVLKLKDVLFRLIFGVFGPWNINTGSKKRFYKINRKKISHDVKSLKHVLDIVNLFSRSNCWIWSTALNCGHLRMRWMDAHVLSSITQHCILIRSDTFCTWMSSFEKKTHPHFQNL